MRKTLEQCQKEMRRRQAMTPESAKVAQIKRTRLQKEAAKSVRSIDYSSPVSYSDKFVHEIYCPALSGVYLLFENGRYYIGQSGNIVARICTHRDKSNLQSNCRMENPRGFLLAETSLTEGWFKDADQRLVSERRFIVAALRIGLELTNSLSENQRESYKAQFAHSGLHQEMTRLQVALRTVQDEEGTVDTFLPTQISTNLRKSQFVEDSQPLFSYI